MKKIYTERQELCPFCKSDAIEEFDASTPDKLQCCCYECAYEWIEPNYHAEESDEK